MVLSDTKGMCLSTVCPSGPQVTSTTGAKQDTCKDDDLLCILSISTPLSDYHSLLSDYFFSSRSLQISLLLPLGLRLIFSLLPLPPPSRPPPHNQQ